MQSGHRRKIDEEGIIFIQDNQDLFHPLELLAQVHDSLGFQIPLTSSWLDHAEMLLALKTSLETPLRWGDVEFVIPADISMGLNMYKEDGIEFKHSKCPKDAHVLAKELEKGYDKLMKDKTNEE